MADTDGAGFIPADAALQANEAGVGFPTANLPIPPIPPGVHFLTAPAAPDWFFGPALRRNHVHNPTVSGQTSPERYSRARSTAGRHFPLLSMPWVISVSSRLCPGRVRRWTAHHHAANLDMRGKCSYLSRCVHAEHGKPSSMRGWQRRCGQPLAGPRARRSQSLICSGSPRSRSIATGRQPGGAAIRDQFANATIAPSDWSVSGYITDLSPLSGLSGLQNARPRRCRRPERPSRPWARCPDSRRSICAITRSRIFPQSRRCLRSLRCMSSATR